MSDWEPVLDVKDSQPTFELVIEAEDAAGVRERYVFERPDNAAERALAASHAARLLALCGQREVSRTWTPEVPR